MAKKNDGKDDGKKRSNMTTVLLLTICLVLVTTGFVLMYVRGQAQKSAEPEAISVYEEIMLADLVNAYPPTPEDVLTFYDKTVLLLYDNSITDEQTLKMIINRQRALYGGEMLELNTADEQLTNLIRYRSALSKRNITINSFEHYPAVFDEDNDDRCFISAITFLNGDSDLYFNYHFRRNASGHWKLYSRQSVNEYFE